MQTVGLTANTANAHAADAVRRVCDTAGRLGLRLVADAATGALAQRTDLETAGPVRALAGRVEAVIVLGGDGTLLQAAHELEDARLPIMGLNIGSLGYLTSVDEAHFDDALLALREDRFAVSERSTLGATLVRADGARTPVGLSALNDVVLSRGTCARLVHIGLELDGTPVTDYACDGVIVATSTGSTAYSLAAGGPVLMPETAARVINVICPHSLGARPLVIPADCRIVLRCLAAPVPLLLALDGRECGSLDLGDWVEIEQSAVIIRLAGLAGGDPYAVLRHKLGWGGSLARRLHRDRAAGKERNA